MDSVYLTPPAARRLEALRILLPTSCGMLLGHKRAHTSIVEDIVPTEENILSDPSVYDSLSQIYGDGIIGFFGTQPHEVFFNSLLCPAAYGKIVLSFKPGPEENPILFPQTVSFNGKFFLEPISIEEQ